MIKCIVFENGWKVNCHDKSCKWLNENKFKILSISSSGKYNDYVTVFYDDAVYTKGVKE
ncbi:unnamed protein product [marine sediment metagenome]|uniref:Uncharacterized protein n=1 Tax=marine sediment metagenome TaxID=412755 RepID=X0XCY4_9ZZZZ